MAELAEERERVRIGCRSLRVVNDGREGAVEVQTEEDARSGNAAEPLAK